MKLPFVLIVVSLLFSTGCAKTLYHWGSYEDDLYRSYKNPEKAPEFEAELLVIIEKAEKKNKKIPPGIAAEYGFAQYKRGQIDSAIRYFELEKEEWPESKALMDTLIQNVRRSGESAGSGDQDLGGVEEGK